MQKQRLGLVIGIVLALAALFMINAYLEQQREVIKQEERKKIEKAHTNQGEVLVAKKDISRGAAIEAAMVNKETVPNKYLQPQAVSSLDRIVGMLTVVPISKGDQITLAKLSYPGQSGGGGLAEITPVGKRAITIPVDNIASLAGMIKPGDYVDVITMIPVPVTTPEGKQATQVATFPLFQNVLILAVGQELGTLLKQESRYAKEEKREASPLITLALSPQEANLIAFVQEQGKIRLILRSPTDSQVQAISPANWDTLFQYVMPNLVQQKGEVLKEEKPEAGHYIEIYRGSKKEKIPLSNK